MWAAATVPVRVAPAVMACAVKRHGQAVVSAPALRVARCPCTEGCQSCAASLAVCVLHTFHIKHHCISMCFLVRPGMSAGVPKYVVVNLKQISEKFADGEEVNLQTVQEKGLFKLTGRESRLPLKVLGDGELSVKVKVSAVKFSGSATEKIASAGGTVNELPGKVKWTKALGKERAEANKDKASKPSRAQKKAAAKAAKQ